MFRIIGPKAKDLCDAHLRPSRRDLLRVGGAGMLGLSLGSLLKLQSVQAAGTATPVAAAGGGPGWGKAKSVIMVYLQGGPSHLDLWDPKPDAAENIRSIFKNIGTKIPGVSFTEILPKLAQMNDKFTMIRSMSYTPNGLFNHTAAIYQMMTGYTTDKVSPSGQLEPPNGQDFPNFGSHIVRLKPPTEPMLPFVMLPRPLQESNVVGKGGTAGFLGKGFDPYTLYPRRRRHGHGQDGPHQGRRPEAAARSLRRPPGAPRQAARHDQRPDAGRRKGRRERTTSTSTTTRR